MVKSSLGNDTCCKVLDFLNSVQLRLWYNIQEAAVCIVQLQCD